MLHRATTRNFFCAGEILYKKGISINISSTAHNRKKPQGKASDFYLLDALKIEFKTENLTLRLTIRALFSKIRALYFPHLLLASYASDTLHKI